MQRSSAHDELRKRLRAGTFIDADRLDRQCPPLVSSPAIGHTAAYLPRIRECHPARRQSLPHHGRNWLTPPRRPCSSRSPLRATSNRTSLLNCRLMELDQDGVPSVAYVSCGRSLPDHFLPRRLRIATSVKAITIAMPITMRGNGPQICCPAANIGVSFSLVKLRKKYPRQLPSNLR
jgi:hypothetical protein